MPSEVRQAGRMPYAFTYSWNRTKKKHGQTRNRPTDTEDSGQRGGWVGENGEGMTQRNTTHDPDNRVGTASRKQRGQERMTG